MIISRAFDPIKDSGFIFSTFPKSVYYSALIPIKQNKKLWFQDFHDYLKDLLPKADIKLAVSKEDADHIVGYSILRGERLEFIYVKELYRKQGIGKFLLKNQTIKQVNEKNLTKVGNALLNKILFKGESREQGFTELN